jgi:hypothetical protein
MTTKAKSSKWRYDGKCGCSVYEACPRCIGIYEQGKSEAEKKYKNYMEWGLKQGRTEGKVENANTILKYKKEVNLIRKQTLKEVLKMADKFNIFEESDTGAIKFIEWLEQKLKELSK